MLRFLLAIPNVLLSLMWSLFIPAQPRTVPPRPAPLPDPDAPSEESQKDGHEVSDANPKTIVMFVIGLFVVIFTAMAALGVMYKHMYANTPGVPVPRAEEGFKYAPHEQTSIARDWDEIDRLAHQRLGGYGWTDHTHGVVRIPIQRAMSLVAAEGLPARTGQPPDFPPPGEEKLPLMQLESNDDATKFDPAR